MTYKQVFIVNQDLDMGKGKIAVQVAHGEIYYMQEILNGHGDSKKDNEMLDRYLAWSTEENELMKKVVLKANEEEMSHILHELAIREITLFSVYDRGLTQIAPNSYTCICVEPLLEEQCNKLFGHLKLL